MKRRHSTAIPFVHLISARTGAGIDTLQQSIAEMVHEQWHRRSSAQADRFDPLSDNSEDAVAAALQENEATEQYENNTFYRPNR
jgi:50S ribosomal subunit-associated GTPase HflX